MAGVAHMSVVVLVCLMYLGKSEGRCEQRRDPYCPVGEKHGRWEHQNKDGDRCVLRCAEGFAPSGCHVLRKPETGKWDDSELPTCIEASGGFRVSGKTLAVVGAGAAAVVAAPFALSAVGFGAAGVAAGSLAAWLQGPATVAGGWFALGQSAGVIGMAATTKATIGGVVSGVTYMLYPSTCEAE